MSVVKKQGICPVGASASSNNNTVSQEEPS